MKKINRILSWIKHKNSVQYSILFLLWIIIGTPKYGIQATLISFGIIILFGIIAGLLIRRFIK